MPDEPTPKPRAHPALAIKRTAIPKGKGPSAWRYAELSVTSNFSFLRGASHPDEMVREAARLGHTAAAITDCNSLAGIVRAHVAAKEVGIPLAIGSRIELMDGLSILVYPTSRSAYANLCRLLTLGKRRTEKGKCELHLHDLIEHADGLLGVVVPPENLTEEFCHMLTGLRTIFGDDRLSLGAWFEYTHRDSARIRQLYDLHKHTKVPLCATNNAHYHAITRRTLQDVLTCIRHGCALDQAGYRLHANAERHLKPGEEMHRLFRQYPDAIARSVDVALRGAQFSLDELQYEYPSEVVPGGETAQSHLVQLTNAGALERYPDGVPSGVRGRIEHELKLIEELEYAQYFLTVHDLVRFARSKGILCQGRGAAANSAVCYCLGVTAVDPDRIDMLFERFVSKERDEPPDIDIDFEHERREEVIQYVYGKYGRDRAALTAEVISYRARSAVREVGKALGLSLDCVDRLAKNCDWWDRSGIREDRLAEIGIDPHDRTIRHLAALTGEIMGFPRHLSQHVGGFVITQSPLCELVPVENASMPDRTVIEWDKDDIDALGFLKVDCLGLGMLSCIRKSMELIERHHDRPLSLATIPAEDPVVYDMICEADTLGVFQIESRAQMAMSPRLKPRCYYDLVIEVAIVRPGPIQGGMVHPYLRRRAGEETFEYPNKEVERVLGKTLGVPLFQEQAMSLAIVAAGFTPGEADQLRRAMAAWKRSGDAIYRFERKLIEGMTARGYSEEFARQAFTQITGFSGYGFPESHAASFALLVYASCWLKRYYPAAFAAALINSQPMGFYAPAQIIRDAQEHGVLVRAVDVNHSAWDCTLEHDAQPAMDRAARRVKKEWGRDGPAIRMGMRLIKGLRAEDAGLIERVRGERGSIGSIDQLRAHGVSVRALKRLAAADAFGSLGLDRQQAGWHIANLRDEPLPLFDGVAQEQTEPALPEVRLSRHVSQDYGTTGLSLKAHPVGFLRDWLASNGAVCAEELEDEKKSPQGRRVVVAGVVLNRQRPSTASGIVFMTLEDETGIANLIARPEVFERFRRAARHSAMIVASGRVERKGRVVHVQVKRIDSLDGVGEELTVKSRNFH